jgi:hypothetical protein
MQYGSINVTKVQALAGLSALASKFGLDTPIPAEEILREVFPGLASIKPPHSVVTWLKPTVKGELLMVEFIFRGGSSSMWGFYANPWNSLTSVTDLTNARKAVGPRGTSIALPPKPQKKYRSHSTVQVMLSVLMCHGSDTVYPGLFNLRNPLIPQTGLCVEQFGQTKTCVEICGAYFAEDLYGIFDQVPAHSWRPADGRTE